MVDWIPVACVAAVAAFAVRALGLRVPPARELEQLESAALSALRDGAALDSVRSPAPDVFLVTQPSFTHRDLADLW